MNTLHHLFRKYWMLFFVIGLFVSVFAFAQLAPFSITQDSDGLFGIGIVSHLSFAQDSGDGGGSGGDSGDGGCGGCGGGDSGGGSDTGGGSQTGGGGGGCTSNCNPPAAPVCVINASPTQLQSGGSTTLTWNSNGGTSASISPGIGAVALSGSMNVPNITSNTTFVLTVTGPGGTVTCQAHIVIESIAPACALTSNPGSISPGGFSTLSWSSSNGSSATLTSFGNVPLTGSAIVTPAVTTTYTLTVTGPGGTVTCQTVVTVQDVPNAPSCQLVANPSTIQSGGSTTLTWTSQNATSASFNQGIGSVAVNGSRTETNITSSRTYTLTVTGPGGTATCQAPIVVQQLPNAPSCTLTANPTVVQNGGSTTLTWTSTNATSASLSGVGTVGLNGSLTINNITANRSFTLTVTGPGGTVNCETNVVVQQQNAPSCTLTASPSQVQSGGSTTLIWTSANASSATLSDVGSVGVNGSFTINNITSNRTFTLTVTGPGGTATCQAPITVTQLPSTPSCTISASPTSISQGQSVYLTWSSTNAVSAFINPSVGSVGTNGSMTVYPGGATTYTLTVTGQNGQTVMCQTNVVVNQIPQYQIPYCTIYANPTSVTQGQSSTLTWNSSNAINAQLSSVGSVGVNGSMTVTPYTTATYVLTVYNAQGQSATCSATVALSQIPYQPPFYPPVQPPIVYPPITYYPPSMPNIPVSYIPYTGDYGPVGNAIFWGLVVTFSISGAYLLLYWRGGARNLLRNVGFRRPVYN